MKDFVHLHLHSEYSLLDGACRISDIPAAAAAAGQSAVAITDHGVMYGALEFYSACIKEGVKPIIGCEVYVAPGSMSEKDHDNKYYHLILLVKNSTGYKNLCYMVSKAFTDGFYIKPRIDMEILRSHSEGLIALSACLAGYIPRQLSAGNYTEAKRHALEMRDIFGADGYYIELQDHGLEEQKSLLPELVRLSENTEIPMVATNDVHYIKKTDAENQAILMCIQTNSVISDGKPIGFETDEFYFKNGDEMDKILGMYDGAIENTVKIAEMCNFDFELGMTYLPRFDVPDKCDANEYLARLADSGIERRRNNGQVLPEKESEYDERMRYELSVISQMGYSEYFLIVWDFVNYARSKGIPVGPGRGSGAGSLIAYLVGITDVDPIKYGLLFERFLNPERVSMPDFDIDFCYNRRDEVIEYVKGKYGTDRVAQIITFGTMAARAVIRDAGRALGMDYSVFDRVARLIPRELGITLKDAMKMSELKSLYNSDPDVKRLIDVSMALEGMPRHASTHAAGVVITDEPLVNYVPLADNGGITVTQFTMDGIAKLGLLKFDFLALRYLTVIAATERQIRENDPDFQIEKIEDDDPEVYAMISKGQTEGVFQLESAGMKQMLQKMKPDKFEEIIAAIALYRPGPMDSIPRYMENRANNAVSGYNIPGIDDILSDTYGCIVYQEQVMQIFRTVAGYSYGRADVVRRAISKKHGDELEREREAFYAGAAERGFDRAEVERLFEDIAGFANYAFNKSHAAAYAVLSYRTAYLKCHYPMEYICALLTSVIGNPFKISEYINEYAKQGIRVLPPDVNKSYYEFHPDNGALRFPLSTIKNVGDALPRQIIDIRRRDGEFKGFTDFLIRVGSSGINKRQLEMLIKSGALDCLGEYRSRMAAVIDKAMEIIAGGNGDDGQLDMFSTSDSFAPMPVINFPQIPEFSAKDKLMLEKELIGVFTSGHVLDDYSVHLGYISPEKISDVKSNADESEKRQTVICGTVSRRSVKNTRKGGRMAFITLEDGSGEIEVILFSSIFESRGYIINTDAPLCVSGTISVRDDEEPKILCSEIFAMLDNEHAKNAVSIPLPQIKVDDLSSRRELPDLPHSTNVSSKLPDRNEHSVQNEQSVQQEHPYPSKLYIKFDPSNERLFKKLRCLFDIFDGAVPVIYYDSANKTYSKNTGVFVSASPMLIGELKSILGDESVVLR